MFCPKHLSCHVAFKCGPNGNIIDIRNTPHDNKLVKHDHNTIKEDELIPMEKWVNDVASMIDEYYGRRR